MSFMQTQVYETDYIEIDGPHGTEIVPCDVDNFDVPEIVNFPRQGDSEDDRTIPGPLAMYCENEWAYTIEKKHGWIGRLSAPGYMDRTDWTSGRSESEVRTALAEMYGSDDDACSKCGEPAVTDDDGDRMCQSCYDALGEIDDRDAHSK